MKRKKENWVKHHTHKPFKWTKISQSQCIDHPLTSQGAWCLLLASQSTTSSSTQESTTVTPPSRGGAGGGGASLEGSWGKARSPCVDPNLYHSNMILLATLRTSMRVAIFRNQHKCFKMLGRIYITNSIYNMLALWFYMFLSRFVLRRTMAFVLIKYGTNMFSRLYNGLVYTCNQLNWIY